MLIIALLLNAEIIFSQSKYLLPCKKGLLEASLDTALAQVGTIERTGRNDGDVEKYQTAAGIPKGSAYCAAGQYYCFLRAAIALSLNIIEIPIIKTGVANYIFNDAVAKGKKTKYFPCKHDLIVWRKGSGRNGHIERIIEPEKAGWVKTVGFNTSSKTSSRKFDYGVFIKRRNIFHTLGRLSVRGLIGFVAY